MTISKTDIIKFALIPGNVEALEKKASNGGSLAMYGIAKGMKYARNVIYCGPLVTFASLTAGIVFCAMDTKSTVRQGLCFTAAAASITFTVMAAKRLSAISELLRSLS